MAETTTAFALGVDEGERLEFGGVTVLVKASAATTGGAFTLFEELPPLVDTPLHVHEHEDELFHVLAGEHVFQVGEQEFAAGPGDVVFAPRRDSARSAARGRGSGPPARAHLAGGVRRFLPGARCGGAGGDARA